MCDMIDSQSAEKISRMKKLRRTLSESFGRIALKKEDSSFDEICVTKMSTRNCQGMDSVIKPLDTIPEDKKVRVQRTQSSFDPFEKPTNQVKRVHSENNACINFKTSSAGKESPKVRRHSSPSSPTSPKFGKADSYEKLEKLGEGSYATVYKGKSNPNKCQHYEVSLIHWLLLRQEVFPSLALAQIMSSTPTPASGKTQY